MLIRTLTVSAIAILAAAAAANADSIGYVQTLGGTASSAASFNSAGGTNSVAIVQPGFFRVTLPGLGNGKHANVQVNAVNTDGKGHYCTSNGWLSLNGSDVIADVNCFDPQGNGLLADFSLLYQARTSPPPTGAIAFLFAEQPGIAIGATYKPLKAFNFNSAGGANRVTHQATGTYVAFLPGIGPNGNPQVTAVGLDPARCEIADWAANGSGTNVTVFCVDATNAPKDVVFDLSYTLGTNEAGGPIATALGGYAWANNAAKKNYAPNKDRQFNSLSPPNVLTAQRFGGQVQGQYSLTIPNPNNLAFNTFLGMVTANGTSGEYCNPAGGMNVVSGEMFQDLICYDSVGRQMNSLYTGQLMFSH